MDSGLGMANKGSFGLASPYTIKERNRAAIMAV